MVRRASTAPVASFGTGAWSDAVIPFYQTELDLKGAGLGQRVPVKLFEGGHSTHYSEEARKPLKAALDKFYDAPPYSGPAAKEASLN
ncbi:hypothetical protein GF108_13250 [Phyllobacterium sp. SYP-B3895]|uniref:hypothetical protein n=1 Tax=Phyllobacterium sp. SYP-B3895 TaxID=2663240 RepID=UPI0012999651|nr:hypothetical protein [Phyllobacterium sp. SYP-B3895]MRG56543.1 hypothetical protein [Phyllobacterium sp. SYP-B3895]